MKKNQIVAFAALAVLAAVSCSKEKSNNDPASDAPVCQTLKLTIDCNLERDITDNFDIVLKTTDFYGKEETEKLAPADYELSHTKTFTLFDANIDSEKGKWPFKLKIDVVEKGGAGTAGSYKSNYKLQVYAEFMDANGKALDTGTEDGRKYFIKKSVSNNAATYEKLRDNVMKLQESECTFVFFRGQSAVSGKYFFSGDRQQK